MSLKKKHIFIVVLFGCNICWCSYHQKRSLSKLKSIFILSSLTIYRKHGLCKRLKAELFVEKSMIWNILQLYSFSLSFCIAIAIAKPKLLLSIQIGRTIKKISRNFQRFSIWYNFKCRIYPKCPYFILKTFHRLLSNYTLISSISQNKIV